MARLIPLRQVLPGPEKTFFPEWHLPPSQALVNKGRNPFNHLVIDLLDQGNATQAFDPITDRSLSWQINTLHEVFLLLTCRGLYA